MPENIVFSSKESRNVQEIGDFLVQIGQKLKEKRSFNLTQGQKHVQVSPSGQTRLELKYEIKGAGKHEFEIEIEWKPDAAEASEKVDIR